MKICHLTDHFSREILDGLHQRGFRTNMGYKDTGLLLTVWVRAGGYYMGMNRRKGKNQIHGITN